MPTITIDGQVCDFEQGSMILQVALDAGLEIPHYCYHPGLSIVASCRICLVEVWAPNPRADNKLEPIPKLLPACQTQAGDGQVWRSPFGEGKVWVKEFWSTTLVRSSAFTTFPSLTRSN